MLPSEQILSLGRRLRKDSSLRVSLLNVCGVPEFSVGAIELKRTAFDLSGNFLQNGV